MDKSSGILVVKTNYNSFDEYINSGISQEGNCDVFDKFTSNNTFQLAYNLLILIIQIVIKRYKCIIVFDDIKIAYFLSFLFRNVNLYYWNEVPNIHYELLKKVKKRINVWTFDPNDSEKLGIKYVQYFYPGKVDKDIKENYDICYFGEDKGRFEYLKEIINECSKKNISYYIKMLVSNINDYSTKYKNILTNEYTNYQNVVEKVKQSKSVLELIKGEQTGFTFRVMESIFFDKKLITNNANMKNEDFYSKDKIFILGEDSLTDLKSFIESPNIKYDLKYKEYYSVRNWLDIISKGE